MSKTLHSPGDRVLIDAGQGHVPGVVRQIVDNDVRVDYGPDERKWIWVKQRSARIRKVLPVLPDGDGE